MVSWKIVVLAGSLIAAAGAPASAQTPATGPAPAGTAKEQPAAGRQPLLDINSASKEELDKLPGIGPARAEAIVKGRPYKGKDELRQRKIIPLNVYDGVKDRIVARQS